MPSQMHPFACVHVRLLYNHLLYIFNASNTQNQCIQNKYFAHSEYCTKKWIVYGARTPFGWWEWRAKIEKGQIVNGKGNFIRCFCWQYIKFATHLCGVCILSLAPCVMAVSYASPRFYCRTDQQSKTYSYWLHLHLFFSHSTHALHNYQKWVTNIDKVKWSQLLSI